MDKLPNKNIWGFSQKIINILGFCIVIIISMILTFSTRSLWSLPVIIVFDFLLISIRKSQPKVGRREYLLYAISLILFYIDSVFIKVPWYSFVLMSIFIPFLYAFIIPRFIAITISGGITLMIFYTYRENFISNFQVIGIGSSIVLSTLLVGGIVYFIEALIVERERIKKTSITDALTNLYNLSYTIDFGERAIEQGKSVAAYVLDVDDFKQFNDTYGHLTGNKVLSEIAKILKRRLEGLNGIIGRLGGDEYVILLIDYPEDKALKFFKDLNCIFEKECVECDPQLTQERVSCSVGFAYSPSTDPIHLEELLHYADVNMYYHKGIRKNKMLNEFPYFDFLSEEVRILLNTLSEKDMYSFIHSQYVVQYCMILAEGLSLPKEIIKEICIGAWMHDIGKITIPNKILRKRGKLSDKEYEIIKSHVKRGLDILRFTEISPTALKTIKFHHERFDGKGYPFGISEKETPIEAKIVQIADAFSAMTIKRVYREVLSLEEALKELKANSGKQFDPELVEVFLGLFNDRIG